MNEISPLPELTLADGTRISTSSGKIVRDNVISFAESDKIKLPTSPIATPTTNRLEDFSIEPKKLNGVAAVLLYTVIGIPRQEVLSALKITEGQLDSVLNSSVFSQLKDKVVTSILDLNSDDIRLRFQAMSKSAVDKVFEVMAHGEDETALRAAQDLLDRAGHRPADIVQHNVRVAGGLKIEFIRRESNNDLPTLEG